MSLPCNSRIFAMYSSRVSFAAVNTWVKSSLFSRSPNALGGNASNRILLHSFGAWLPAHIKLIAELTCKRRRRRDLEENRSFSCRVSRYQVSNGMPAACKTAVKPMLLRKRATAPLWQTLINRRRSNHNGVQPGTANH